MKILMTGATTLQIKPPEVRRTTQTKIDVPGAVVDVLREAGHEVDWRAVKLGEDLSGYDLLWINLAGVLSMNARPGAMGMLWAIAQVDVPAVLFLDDWKTRLTFQQAKSFSERGAAMYYDRHLVSPGRLKYTRGVHDTFPTHYTREGAEKELARILELVPEARGDNAVGVEAFYYQRPDYTDAEWDAARPVCIEGARLMREGRPNSAIGIPAYQWGDRDIVRPTLPEGIRDAPLISIDPSFIALNIATEAKETIAYKSAVPLDRWGLAALGDHTEWIEKELPDLKWDVISAGHSSNHKLKTEHDVVAFYRQTHGILSPSYYHAGSGWWRSRFIYAAMLGIPIYAADGEADALGEAYQVSAYDIEKMDDLQRDQLAHDQFIALVGELSTREQFAKQVIWLMCQPFVKEI